MVRTKIVCTLGPSSSNRAVMRKMMLKGMDVARLNFSHGTHDQFLEKIRAVRSLNADYRRRVKILGDLKGHRIRIGKIPAPLELKKNQVVWLTRGDFSAPERAVPFDYRGPLKTIIDGSMVFIDDGNIALEVVGRSREGLKTKVFSGGALKAYKGVNIPGAKLSFGPISDEDLRDISFCAKHGIEYIAQSFVRGKRDILEVRGALPENSPCLVIAKIECREGIRNINEIIAASDGIMIARGDMGVSVPVYQIPVIQKKIIAACNQARKPVITATQMLESMTVNSRPTRAEVSDISNAVLDGTDFVMLSAETAAGRYPVEAVDMMNSVIKYTEAFVKEKTEFEHGKR